MADFMDYEAEESEEEGSEAEMEVAPVAKRTDKKKRVLDSDDDEDEDDGEEVKDLIDDNPIEDESDNESERSRKRKKSDDEDDEDFDDRLEDEDYELLEENLGVKVQRKKFKRLRRIQEEDSDEETAQDAGEDREAIANQLFEGSDNEEERIAPREESTTQYASEESGGEYSETDDFIVDDEGRPLTEKRKKRKPIFTDSSLQEAQDIFGVDFDYDDFEKYDDEYYEEEEEEDEDYENEDEEQRATRLAKKPVRKGRKPKSIYEIYEPSELERAGFTDDDNLLRSKDMPERMQLRIVPIVPAVDEELDEESEWIYDFAFREDKPDSATPAATQLKQGKNLFDKDTTLSTIADTSVAAEDDWDQEVVPQTVNVPAPIPVNGANTNAGDDDEDWDQPATNANTPSAPATVVQEPVSSSALAVVSVDAEEPLKPKIIPKIRKALEFMRNQHLEVPFIAFYRKEYVRPELSMNDLWTIYRLDARFCQLRSRKTRLSVLYRNMQSYQSSLIFNKPDEPISESMRLVTEQDLDRVKSIRTHEELKDVYLHFTLYYSQDVEAMKEFLAKKKTTEQSHDSNPDANDPLEDRENDGVDDELGGKPGAPVIKRKPTGGSYALCRKFGLDPLAKQFGLTPEKFAENLRDNYQRHEVEQYPTDTVAACKDFISPRLPSAEEVMKAAKFMVGIQISREPMVRKCVREVFFERATLDVTPTKKGLKEIDESHPIYTMKYIRDKPVRDLKEDTFLKLCIAEDDGLITLNIGETITGITALNYVEEVKQLYYKDEFSKDVQEWNKVRGDCVEFALEVQLYPALRKELRAKLLESAKKYVLEKCASNLQDWIKIKPYEVSFPDEDDEEWDTNKGTKVLAIAYVPDFDQASFACLISSDGDASDYLRLQNIVKQKNAFRESDRIEKEADLVAMKNFVRQKKPHVIVIGGESREAQMIQEDLKNIVTELMGEDGFPNINVEILDNAAAKVYASSLKASTDFREYPLLLRQAISLGRRIQDPLIEFSQLCTPDDEILCLRFHPLQDHVSKEELLEYIQLEFVNRTNEVGVDVNRAIAYPFTFNLVQFTCGLGPRKAAALVKTLKQNNQRLENRTQLITVCHMGPKIFINCSGFIKIDTNSLGDSTEAYVEVLDGTRVHPETYEWARKMAVDACEYDDEDANPAGALEEILEAPERLKDLDLDAFAEELERQGFGNKSITLYDIRAELSHVDRYKDQRIPYQSPHTEALFNMLTGETPETLYVGKLITATVVGISHKKPQGEQLDNAIPVRNEDTGMWQCSFCLKNDFPDLSEVWNHFDANACPGQATGIRLRLDNGITGFIPISKLSDKQVTNPENRVKRGQTIHCRVSKIDVERFQVECTSRTSDLADIKDEWRKPKDPYYDKKAEDAILKKDQESKKMKERQTYVKRVIVHQAFRNISYKESEQLMERMDQGEVVVRPSSKGADHLTVTWKVSDGVYQHIDVKEEKKENAFSLGQSLWIAGEEFEDLDEILARHINPMASYARDALNFKYYKALQNRIMAEEYLLKEKEKSSNKIHYVLFASKEYPGKFVLAYLPKTKVYHELITIRPEGFRFRQQNFDSLLLLFKWFKEHYRDPQPSGTPVAAPAVQHLRTPYTTPGYNDFSAKTGPATLVGGISHSHGLANTTPHYATPAQAYTPFSAFTSQTPYTPTAQTPYMTPYQTPATTPKISTSHTTHGAQPGFVQPAPASGQRGAQQRIRSSTTTGTGNEALDWRKAAEAWAKSQQKSHSQSTHRAENLGQPPTRNAAQVIFEGIEKTRQMSSSAHNFLSHKSPKSGRDSLKSTPRTNFSPRSMVESSLGDETPLFDEN